MQKILGWKAYINCMFQIDLYLKWIFKILPKYFSYDGQVERGGIEGGFESSLHFSEIINLVLWRTDESSYKKSHF